MLPVTADNIFWAAEVSSSFAVRAVLGGIVRWRVFVSDTPSPSADSILSWSWPCVCTAAMLIRSRAAPSWWLHRAQWREKRAAFVSSAVRVLEGVVVGGAGMNASKSVSGEVVEGRCAYVSVE